MVTLSKALTFSMLTFGTFAWGGGDTSWQQPQHTNHTNQNYQAASHNTDHDQKKHHFYKLSWQERKRLCSDDSYWQSWSWYYGNNKHDYCKQPTKHHNKQSAPAVPASQQQTSQLTPAPAAAHVDQRAAIAVEAVVDQRTVINNYNYIVGNNNVINNAVSVNNNAHIEQQASISQAATAVAEQTSASTSLQHHQLQQASEHQANQQVQEQHASGHQKDCPPCDDPCHPCKDQCDDWQQNNCDDQPSGPDCYSHV